MKSRYIYPLLLVTSIGLAACDAEDAASGKPSAGDTSPIASPSVTASPSASVSVIPSSSASPSVTASPSVSASLTPSPSPVFFTVSVVADQNGQVFFADGSQNSGMVAEGSDLVLNLVPDLGYEVGIVSGCDGTLSGTSYTTGIITADCTVNVTFAEIFRAPDLTLDLAPNSMKTFRLSWQNNMPGTAEIRVFKSNAPELPIELARLSPEISHYDLELALPANVFSSFFVAACTANGRTCLNSNRQQLDAAWVNQAIGQLEPSFNSPNSDFGHAVAISKDGNTLAIGAPLQDWDNITEFEANSGWVHIFTKQGNSWIQSAQISPLAKENQNFGHALALNADGTRLIVGSPGDGSNVEGVFPSLAASSELDSSAPDRGAAHVYHLSNEQWSRLAYLKPDFELAAVMAEDRAVRFGHSVAISDDGLRFAVGALHESTFYAGIDGQLTAETGSSTLCTTNECAKSGAVYLYQQVGNQISREAFIKAEAPISGGLFGSSLALSGDGSTLAVGAEGYAPQNPGTHIRTPRAGNVYVFAKHQDQWSQQATLNAPSIVQNDFFGRSVALSENGDQLAIGAAGRNNFDGAVYVWQRDQGQWSQQQELGARHIAGSTMNLGESVAITADGTQLLVGAVTHKSSVTGLNINGLQSPRGDNRYGAAYWFVLQDNGWQERGGLKPRTVQLGGRFGQSVAISGDGSVLLVGEPKKGVGQASLF